MNRGSWITLGSLAVAQISVKTVLSMITMASLACVHFRHPGHWARAADRAAGLPATTNAPVLRLAVVRRLAPGFVSKMLIVYVFSHSFVDVAMENFLCSARCQALSPALYT